jgi:hypothetical protein
MSIPNTINPRRRDLDVVREVIVVGLVFFHTARIFDDLGFYVKNEPQQSAVSFIVILFAIWGMPLIFFIAGIAIWYSLQERTVGAFVRERLQRLFVPFIVSLLVIVPPQIYCRLSTNPAYQETYAQFYPRFFDISLKIEFPWFFSASPATGLFHPAHTWFLYNLLLYSLLLLPVFHYLRKLKRRQLIERVACFSASPIVIFLPALPIALIEATLGTDMSGGWNQLVYMVFLFCGYIYATDSRFGSAFCKYRKQSLGLALVGSVVGLVGLYVHVESSHVDPLRAYDITSVLLRFFKGLVGWCGIVSILGFLEYARNNRQLAMATHSSINEAREPRRMQNVLARIERYANEAVLPFYLLHQTVIVIIGYYVVQWPIGALMKFLTISFSTLATTLLLYEVVIRRTRLMRFLFGMKSGYS